MRKPLAFSAVLVTTLFLTTLTGCSPKETKTEPAISTAPVAQADITGLSTALQFFEAAEQSADSLAAPSDKLQTLAIIAQARYNSGDANGALRTLQKMEESAKLGSSTDPTFTQLGLPTLAETQALLGKEEDARKTADSIEDTTAKSLAYSRIVIAEAKNGDLAGAQRAVGAAAFTLGAHQYSALAAVAAAAAAKGDMKSARMIASKVEQHWRPKAYADMALSQYKAGNNNTARKLIQEAKAAVALVKDPKEPSYEAANRTEALLAIAQTQIDIGDKDGAKKTLEQALQYVEKMGADSRHDYLLARLSMRLLSIGNQTGARRAANEMDSAAQRQLYFDAVNGNRIIATPDRQTLVQSPIAKEVQSGDIEGAKKIAQSLTEPASRAQALSEIATLLTQNKTASNPN